MVVDTIVDTLAGAAGFSDLPLRALARVARRGYHRGFSPGEKLYRQGEPAHSLFVILSGRVSISAAHPHLVDADLIAVLERGDLAGETGVLDGAARWGTATALTATETLALSAQVLVDLIVANAASSTYLLSLISRRFRSVDELARAYPRHSDRGSGHSTLGAGSG